MLCCAVLDEGGGAEGVLCCAVLGACDSCGMRNGHAHKAAVRVHLQAGHSRAEVGVLLCVSCCCLCTCCC